jgi:hypothetical protein
MREGWKRKASLLRRDRLRKRMINVELQSNTRGLGATARPEGARPNKNHYYSLFDFHFSPFYFLLEHCLVLALWLHLGGNAKGGKKACGLRVMDLCDQQGSIHC